MNLSTSVIVLKLLGGLFDIDLLKKKIEEYDIMMEDAEFWNNSTESSYISKNFKLCKSKVEEFESLLSTFDYLGELLELIKCEEDEEYTDTFETDFSKFKSSFDKFNIKTLLNGEYDKNNVFLSLHSGAGGVDAQDWTEMLFRMYVRWCEANKFSIEVIDEVVGDEAGIKGATIKISGEYAYGYLKGEKGIHRLVRISPFNANGKRQTSFASVEVLPEIENIEEIKISDNDLKIDTYKASGAGGQHVNKTESAVRITHLKTGIVVQCQNGRSQASNKEIAMKMLLSKLIELKDRTHKEKLEDLTGDLKDIGFGSQIRSYVLHPYSMVKDHRIDVETSDVLGVLDGKIDIFIGKYIRKFSND